MRIKSWVPLQGATAKLGLLGVPLLVCTSLSAAPDDRPTEFLLRDMQNELILGSEFSLPVATCLDEEMSYAWVLSSRAPREISDRTLTRLQRAREACVTTHDGADPSRATTRAVHKLFADNLEARRKQEAKKVEIRACMESSRDVDGFGGCLKGRSLVKASDPFWTRWLGLFELFSSNRALSSDLK